MRVNKIFGVKSITNLIYGMLLLLPMFSILSRVIYTQANPNAKDSYSDSYISKIDKVSDNTALTTGLTYYVNYNSEGTQNSNKIFYSYISINWVDYGAPNLEYDGFYFTSTAQIHLYVGNNAPSYTIQNGVWGITLKEFYFTAKSGGSGNNIGTDTKANYYLFTYVQEKLDNVFEYSLNSFLSDYDVDGVDFFSWFTNLFLNQSNQHNALYLNFCNWYMNYVLLVSSAYLLFFALMWFINYIRKLLEKSSYQDFGGF